jgi:hypothetical protein
MSSKWQLSYKMLIHYVCINVILSPIPDMCHSLSLSLSLSLWLCSPARAMASSFTRFRDHTQRRATVGRTPLDEWSARRRDLYLTTHNIHNRQTSMPRWDSNARSQQASGLILRLRPRDHWDRPDMSLYLQFIILNKIITLKYVWIVKFLLHNSNCTNNCAIYPCVNLRKNVRHAAVNT